RLWLAAAKSMTAARRRMKSKRGSVWSITLLKTRRAGERAGTIQIERFVTRSGKWTLRYRQKWVAHDFYPLNFQRQQALERQAENRHSAALTERFRGVISSAAAVRG